MCKYTYNSNKNLFLFKYFIRSSSSGGFALPQILLLSIGLSIALVSLLNVSINKLSTSKIKKEGD